MITQEALEWLRIQPIGKDNTLDIAKGVNQFPFTVHQFTKFIKFSLAYSGKNVK
jgi:hypothetical protein